MKLVHPDFLCQINLPENRIPILIFESSTQFRKFVSQLKEQVDGNEREWVLSDKGTILNLSKTCELIIDFFSLDINQRKMISALHNRLEKEMFSSEMLVEWNAFSSVLLNYTEKICCLSEHNLKYKETLEVKDFFKFMNISFEDSSDHLLDKMIDYMVLSSAVAGTRLFVLCNAKSFFDSAQLMYLYEQAFYRKYHLLLIESHVSNEKHEVEDIIIIDKDNCVICYNDVE